MGLRFSKRKVLYFPKRFGSCHHVSKETNNKTRTTMTTTIKPDAIRSARVFGCSVDQAKKLFLKNADEALVMIERAKQSGGRYRNYSIAQLVQMERDYRAASC